MSVDTAGWSDEIKYKRFKATPTEVCIEDEPRLAKALKYKDVKREDYATLNSVVEEAADIIIKSKDDE